MKFHVNHYNDLVESASPHQFDRLLLPMLFFHHILIWPTNKIQRPDTFELLRDGMLYYFAFFVFFRLKKKKNMWELVNQILNKTKQTINEKQQTITILLAVKQKYAEITFWRRFNYWLHYLMRHLFNRTLAVLMCCLNH